jgi:hypothetical protein
MSVQMDGSLFVGDTLPNNNGGLDATYGGWIVASGGAKLGGDIDTLGNIFGGTGTFRNGDDSAGNNAYNQLIFGYGGTTDWAHYVRTRHNDSDYPGNAIDFYTNTSQQGGTDTPRHGLTIQNGWIGVNGNTDPQYAVDVNGNAGAAANRFFVKNNGKIVFVENSSEITEQRPGQGYEFVAIPTITVTGTGYGGTLNVQFGAGDLTYTTVSLNDPGQGYYIGDQIKVTGDLLGGETPANDLIVSIAGMANNHAEPWAGEGVNYISGVPFTYIDGLHVRANGLEWTFGNDGNLILNGGIRFGDGTLQTTAATGGGGSSFTTGTVDLHNGGVQNAQLLQFTDGTRQSVITGPAPADGNSAQRLIIQGQRATTGEGGDVYIWGGDSDIDGGDIKIYAGDADSSSEGYGGYVNISAGRGHTIGGELHLDGGYSSAGNGGTVRIRAGQSGNSTLHGMVEVNSGGKSWHFNPDGTLTFPVNLQNNQWTTTQQFGMGNLFAFHDGSYWTIGTGNPETGDIGDQGIGISPGIESSTYLYLPRDAEAFTQPTMLGNNIGNTQIVAGNNSWKLNNDGTTSFPNNTIATAPSESGYIVKNLEPYTREFSPGSNAYVWDHATCPVMLTNWSLFVTGFKIYPTGHPDQFVTVLGSGDNGTEIILSFDGPLLPGQFYTAEGSDYVATPNPIKIKSSHNSLTLDIFGNLILDNDTEGAHDRGIFWNWGARNGGINAGIFHDEIGLTVRGFKDNDAYSGGAPVNILTNPGPDNHRWTFDELGRFRAAGHIITDLGRYYQDCTDGYTSFRWVNAVDEGNDIELGRAYSDGGNPYSGDQNESNERVQFGFKETESNSSNFYIISTENPNGIGDSNADKRWEFQGTGGFQFPDESVQTTAFNIPSGPTPPAKGLLWFNPVEARVYVKYNNQWVDASPTVLPEPDNNPTFESVTFNDASVQTTAWTGTYSYNDLTDKPTFVGGGGASTWLTAE